MGCSPSQSSSQHSHGPHGRVVCLIAVFVDIPEVLSSFSVLESRLSVDPLVAAVSAFAIDCGSFGLFFTTSFCWFGFSDLVGIRSVLSVFDVGGDFWLFWMLLGEWEVFDWDISTSLLNGSLASLTENWRMHKCNKAADYLRRAGLPYKKISFRASSRIT